MRLAPLVLSLVTGLAACTELPPPEAPVRPAGELAALDASVDLDGRAVGRADGATLVFVFASWCPHCHDALAVLDGLRPAFPRLRVLGVNYRGHEEYDGRGSSDAVRAYVARHAPWLRVVPADDALFAALGQPPKIPTLYVYDRAGTLRAIYDRRQRRLPDAAELRALLARIGA